MKRSPSLIRLSHDHQHGLAVALELTRATDENAAHARQRFLTFWHEEGRDHFRAEEEELLPAAARHLEPQHEAIVRVLVEHVELRRRASDLESERVPGIDSLRALGAQLRSHIRHEERVLFPLIEEALDRAELARLGARLERNEPR